MNIHEIPGDEGRGAGQLFIFIIISALAIFNLALTKHLWDKKKNSVTNPKKFDLLGSLIIGIMSLILISLLYLALTPLFK